MSVWSPASSRATATRDGEGRAEGIISVGGESEKIKTDKKKKQKCTSVECQQEREANPTNSNEDESSAMFMALQDVLKTVLYCKCAYIDRVKTTTPNVMRRIVDTHVGAVVGKNAKKRMAAVAAKFCHTAELCLQTEDFKSIRAMCQDSIRREKERLADIYDDDEEADVMRDERAMEEMLDDEECDEEDDDEHLGNDDDDDDVYGGNGNCNGETGVEHGAWMAGTKQMLRLRDNIARAGVAWKGPSVAGTGEECGMSSIHQTCQLRTASEVANDDGDDDDGGNGNCNGETGVEHGAWTAGTKQMLRLRDNIAQAGVAWKGPSVAGTGEECGMSSIHQTCQLRTASEVANVSARFARARVSRNKVEPTATTTQRPVAGPAATGI